MNNKLTYKEFIGTVSFASDDEVFYGKVEGINDLVTFEGSTVIDLKKAFQESVDEYIELCKDLGKEINRSFKDSFNVRNALIQGKTLNQFIQEAIELKLNTVN